MTLPANDAFTLGLTGSHDPNRPTYALSFRSTSPKIPFVSGTKSSYSSALSNKPQRQTRRSMSNGVPNGTSASSPDTHNNRRTHSDRAVHKVPKKPDNVVLLKKQNDVVVDWEIPRKTLHSSIGSSSPYLNLPRTQPHASYRLFNRFLDIISLYLSWLSKTCCRLPQFGPRRNRTSGYPPSQLSMV